MASNSFRITIKGEDADNSIRLGDLIDQLNAIKSTLNLIDIAVSGQKTPSLYYRITGITMNSPATFVVEAVGKQASSAMHGRRVVAKLSRDLRAVIGGRRPKVAELDLLESYGSLVQPRKHLAQVSLQFDKEPLALPRNLGMTIDEILGPDQIEKGSVVGSLDVIDVHNRRNQFKVYPIVGPSSIRCQFSEGMLPQAIAGIKHFVRISGELHFKKTEKFPHLIRVSKIEVLPERSDAGALSGLRGMATGALQGMSSTDFVERARDGGW
jgi:hypothetical protein